jgi:hypothetical protein
MLPQSDSPLQCARIRIATFRFIQAHLYPWPKRKAPLAEPSRDHVTLEWLPRAEVEYLDLIIRFGGKTDDA